MKKLAIIGYGLSRKLAPFEDPDFEIWGLNVIFYKVPHPDRWFEMHHRCLETVEPPQYRQWLATQTRIPVYMRDFYKDIPAACRYPIEEITNTFGPYLTSTVTMMMALGIYEGFGEIHLYGISPDPGSVYAKQRACIEYYLGIMHGAGIEYYFPPDSHLLEAEEIYGYEKERSNGTDEKGQDAG